MWQDGNGGEGGGMGDGYSSDSGGISTVAAGGGRGIWIRRRFSMICEFPAAMLRVDGVGSDAAAERWEGPSG